MSLRLQRQAVVAEYDKGGKCSRQSEAVSAENCLADGASLADGTDEERGGYAPHHPVSPVEDGPVLRERRGAQRVGPCGHADEILHHVADSRNSRLNGIAGLSAADQHVEQQAEEEPGTGGRQLGDALHTEINGDSVDDADDDKDYNCQHVGFRDPGHAADRHGEQRGGKGKCGSRPCQQRKNGDQVDDFSSNSIHVLSEDRTAGLRILLFGALPDVKHEAECHGQHHIKTPGNRSPMKEGIGGGPVLKRPHVCNVRFIGVEYPLAERVEENVGRKACRKHHGSPFKIGVLRLLYVSQLNLSVSGKCHVE